MRALQKMMTIADLSFFVVDRIKEVLLIGVERDNRSQYQQLNTAGLQQLDLVGLRQRSERADLSTHVKTSDRRF